MFGSIGGFELLVLMGIGLLVFGPRRLPEIGRTLAKGLNELRRAAGDLTAAIQQETDLGEVKKTVGDLQATLQAKAAGVWRDLESEAGAVRSAVERTEPATQTAKTEEPHSEPGGPVGAS